MQIVLRQGESSRGKANDPVTSLKGSASRIMFFAHSEWRMRHVCGGRRVVQPLKSNSGDAYRKLLDNITKSLCL